MFFLFDFLLGAAFGLSLLPDNIKNFLIGLTKAEIDTATRYFAAHFGDLFGGPQPA